jgi:hypothetical protein
VPSVLGSDNRVNTMACERGRIVQKELDEAIAARRLAEHLGPVQVRIAKKRETDARLDRIIHVSGCSDCWAHPPEGMQK